MKEEERRAGQVVTERPEKANLKLAITSLLQLQQQEMLRPQVTGGKEPESTGSAAAAVRSE